MALPLFLELDTPGGWIRLEIESASEAGLTLANGPALASVHALLLRPGDLPAVLVIPNEMVQSQRRYEVRVRLVGSLDPGRPIELAFTALTPSLREQLRVPIEEPAFEETAGVGAFAFARADAPPPRDTLLPNGRRLLLPSSATVYEVTRTRRAENVSRHSPTPSSSSAAELPPRLWLRALVPALVLGIGVLGLALIVALGAALAL